MVRARWAKMSRMSAVRSMTLSPSEPPRLRSCTGESGSSEIMRFAPSRSEDALSSSTLPLPKYSRGVGAWRSWVIRPTTSAPADSARRPNSSSDSSTSKRRCRGSRRAARSARSLFLTRSAPPLRSRCGRHARRSGAPVLSSSLGPSLPCDLLGDPVSGALGAARLTDVEPPDAGLAREPGHLPLGVATGVAHHQGEGLVLRQPPALDVEELPVADARHAGRRLVIAGLQESPHLVHHPTGEHPVRALFEVPVQRAPLLAEADQQQPPRRNSRAPAGPGA